MAKTFEQDLLELETIVGKLESGEYSLDESLALFEAGVKISRKCRERLSTAERRIEVLLAGQKNDISVSDLDPEDLRDV